MVVDEADDPDLLVLGPAAAQEEWTLDVDVPELVRPGSLVRRPALASDRWPGGPELGEEAVDGVVVERVDQPAGELGGQALRVPIGQETHHDDRLLDPRWQAADRWATRPIEQRVKTAALVARSPAMKAGAADPEGERCGDAVFAGDPDRAGPGPETGQIRTRRPPRRTTATRRQEEEPRALLIGVPKETTMRLGPVLWRGLVHRPTLGPFEAPCLTNPGNYT